MKTNIKSKTKRVAKFALGLPIVLTSLISQAYSSDSNKGYFGNQEKSYEVVHVVQMMPIEPIIDAVNRAAKNVNDEVQHKIEFENSSTHNALKEVAVSNYKIEEQGSRTEDRVIFLEQKISELIQQNLKVEQQNSKMIQQYLKIEQHNSELRQQNLKVEQQNTRANAFLEQILQKIENQK